MREFILVVLTITTAFFGLLGVFSGFFFTRENPRFKGAGFLSMKPTKKTIALQFFSLSLFALNLALLMSYYDPLKTLGITLCMTTFIIVMAIPFGIKYLFYQSSEDCETPEPKE
jgi:hypothetical protein